jgi:fructose-bisphosphate aldolase class 1
MAQRGDLVVLMDSGRVIAGIVHLSGKHIVAAGDAGLKRMDIMTIKRAWRL